MEGQLAAVVAACGGELTVHALGERVRNRPHAHDHVARKHAGRRTGDVRVVHRHVHAFFNLADGNARLQQRAFKRKAATD